MSYSLKLIIQIIIFLGVTIIFLVQQWVAAHAISEIENQFRVNSLNTHATVLRLLSRPLEIGDYHEIRSLEQLLMKSGRFNHIEVKNQFGETITSQFIPDKLGPDSFKTETEIRSNSNENSVLGILTIAHNFKDLSASLNGLYWQISLLIFSILLGLLVTFVWFVGRASKFFQEVETQVDNIVDGRPMKIGDVAGLNWSRCNVNIWARKVVRHG
jgi:Na+-transporting methylmalonyl-CoA/oxaloacetate decarboxylase gamma subunit